MAQFSPAFTFTLGNEGGYANNPADPGGETYEGISKVNCPGWEGWPAVDAVVTSTNGDVAAINSALAGNATVQAQVQDFYEANYWTVNLTGSINDQPTANQLFDIAVNMGTGTGALILQNAINDLSAPPTPPLTVDGNIGPLTIAAANGANVVELYNMICTLRANHYNNIIASNPSMEQFRASWFSRMPPYPTAS